MSSSQNPPPLYSADNSTSTAFQARVACPICNIEGAPTLFLARDRVHHLPGIFGIHRCAHFHAHFVQPSLSEQDLAGNYPEEYGRFRVSKSLGKKTIRDGSASSWNIDMVTPNLMAPRAMLYSAPWHFCFQGSPLRVKFPIVATARFSTLGRAANRISTG